MFGARLEPAGVRRGSALALAAALGAFGLAGCGGEDAVRRPNVLLISLDTLRADHLHAYGYGRETSPRIDALASSGVLFEDAVSTTSWTLPAHLSMLTGLAISAHGVCDERLWQLAAAEGGAGDVPLRGTFLPEVLQAAGYQTAGFYTWKYLEPRFGFGPGFDVYTRVGHSVFSHPEWSARFDALRAAGDVEAIQRWRDEEPEIFDEQRPTAGEAVDQALAWLEARDPARPFFLFVHLFDAHDGYVPPPPFRDRFTDPGYDGPITGRNVTTPDSLVRADMAPRDLEQLIALYDGEIAWVDSQVGRLLDRLHALGLGKDTLVVLTSDHGEEFFEHGAKTHRAQLYRESVHVPLILAWPGRLPAGRRVAGTVGIVDILPTVLGLAGLRAPPRLSGRDLGPAALGEAELAAADYLTELVVFPPEGSGAPDRHTGLWFAGRHALLVQRGGAPQRAEVFDCTSNPEERGAGTAVPAGSEAARALSERLDAQRSELRAARAAAAPRGVAAQALTARDIEELAKMGYAGLDKDLTAARDTAEERLCLDGCVWPD